MKAFFAYKNKWGRVVVKPLDVADVIDAIKSPSVHGIIRQIDAENLNTAECVAKRLFAAGEFEQTFAGMEVKP